ncbi:MAG TPA: lysylphosphatidylglycerol synthase transmembrane domain-containing protein [Candidatus Binatia bacterium]|nr:lysylphosphatidylglycerol synthase transmembrane domain-containing protein [Candidatus Binatia bacterium]
MSRASRAARWCLRIAVSVGIVSYILVDVSKRDLLHALLRVRVHLVAGAVALYLLGQLLSALKWATLGRSVGLRGSIVDYTRFYFIGMFFNLFGPSTLGGDVVRALYLGGGRRPGLALNSVLFDRLSGLAVLMAVAAVALLAFPQYDFPPLLQVTTVVCGLGLVLGWWTCPRLVRLLPASNRLRHLIEVELAPFWRDRLLLLRVAAISLAFHLSQVGVQYVLCRAAGADVSFSYCLIFHPILSVMLALPVSLGGFGVREGGYLYFLTRINVDDSIAVTMGLLWWAVTVCAGLVGGALFFAAGAQLPRLRAHTAEEAA